GLFATDDFSVLLSHYPILPKHCSPNLMLSGHTHGGQFNCLGLTPYSIGFEQLGKKRHLAPARIAGLAEMGETTLLVSKGLGMSRIPLRVCVRREVHLITLKYKKAP
ncbi:MAG: hypothetical protein MJ099_04250, partial [Clostridia bacterium]|nr:hypothetical protein [Clostridia bacterium]